MGRKGVICRNDGIRLPVIEQVFTSNINVQISKLTGNLGIEHGKNRRGLIFSIGGKGRYPGRTVDLSRNVKNPGVPGGGVLQIQNPLELAGQGTVYQSQSFKVHF